MLLKDFVRETAGESKELLALARRLTQRYNKKPQREIKLGSVDFGSIEEPSLQALLRTVTVKFDSRFDRSLYNPRTKEILMKLSPDLDLESELAHELQHALDDLKSQGQFRREPGDYMTRQSEVNARLTQAIKDIEAALRKARASSVDWQNPRLRGSLEKLVRSYLKKHRLTPQDNIDQKRYQRLIKRILGYILSHL